MTKKICAYSGTSYLKSSGDFAIAALFCLYVRPRYQRFGSSCDSISERNDVSFEFAITLDIRMRVGPVLCDVKDVCEDSEKLE